MALLSIFVGYGEMVWVSYGEVFFCGLWGDGLGELWGGVFFVG